jgi:hypothetical protein
MIENDDGVFTMEKRSWPTMGETTLFDSCFAICS